LHPEERAIDARSSSLVTLVKGASAAHARASQRELPDSWCGRCHAAGRWRRNSDVGSPRHRRRIRGGASHRQV